MIVIEEPSPEALRLIVIWTVVVLYGLITWMHRRHIHRAQRWLEGENISMRFAYARDFCEDVLDPLVEAAANGELDPALRPALQREIDAWLAWCERLHDDADRHLDASNRLILGSARR